MPRKHTNNGNERNDACNKQPGGGSGGGGCGGGGGRTKENRAPKAAGGPTTPKPPSASLTMTILAAHARLLILRGDNHHSESLARLVGKDTGCFVWVGGLHSRAKFVTLQIRGPSARRVRHAVSLVNAVLLSAQTVRVRGATAAVSGRPGALRSVQASSGASVVRLAAAPPRKGLLGGGEEDHDDDFDEGERPIEICGSPKAVLRAMYLLQHPPSSTEQ